MYQTSVLISLLLSLIVHQSSTQERRCDVPADVVFLMDASDSIKDTEWEQEKNFVSVLIDNLEVERYAIHVGVIVYSTDIGMVIDLQPFKTKAQLKSLLQQAVQINQGTDTAKAISKLIEMSDSQGRIEGDAKQIAVIITDGRSTDVSATIREARRARSQYKIDMIALGVGNETFAEELEAIAGVEKNNRLFQVQNFAQLHYVIKQLEDIICEIVPTSTTTIATSPITTTTAEPTTSPFIPPFPCSRPADVVFLIDGSYSITAADWIKGKQFVSYLINSIDIGIDSIHVGIIVYGSSIGDVVSLTPFRSKAQLKQAASDLIQPPVGRTNTALGLQTVRDMFDTQARIGVPHIAIVITDGMSSNPSETRDQASRAKLGGVTLFVVGVGNRVLRQEVEDMASSLQTLFDAPDFKYLVGMVELLRDNICSAIQETTTTSSSSTTTTTARMTTRPPVPELCLQCLVEGGVGFNPLPEDCEKYVLCFPVGPTYEPHIKSCPFGMFWSNESVSCLDARYVDCPWDKCAGPQKFETYSSTTDTANCRSYMRCVNGRSTPTCCETGYRYKDGAGCVADTQCQDVCPLDVTIFNQGSCRFRPDHDSYYSYLEVIPGKGNVKRNCDPGQVYSPALCACTYDVGKVIPDVACLPAVNLTFDGSFEDSSTNALHIDVKKVGLTDLGTAYFDGDGYITLPTTANLDLGDKFSIRLRYRLKTKTDPGQILTNNEWGFQNWFKNASNQGANINIITGNKQVNLSDPGNISGAESKPLEVITITKNGTVLRDPRYDFTKNETWGNTGPSVVHVVQLGKLGNITTPTIKNGIVYIPNGQGKLLIQESDGLTAGSIKHKWSVLSVNPDGKTGKLEETGQGGVPQNIQQKFNFDLRSPVLERWFIMAPGGIVLQKGEGPIPADVLNRYAGFSIGTLVKVFDRGDRTERWQISKPDGSELQEGFGEIPKTLINDLKLTSALTPHQVTSTWSVIAQNGEVLETGKGTIPSETVKTYSSDPTITVLKSTSRDGGAPVWKITRANGVEIVEGIGALPQGIAQFVKGSILLPQIATVNGWKVKLPNGDIRSGDGPIPQSILDLFTKHYSSPANKVADTNNQVQTAGTNNPVVVSKWSVTLPDGTVRSGFGEMPAELKNAIKSQGQRWEVTLGDGTVRSGEGNVPVDLLNSPVGRGTSASSTGSNQEKRWSLTMPDGTVKSGQGDVPLELQKRLQESGAKQQWEITLPDGKVQRGSGPIPEHLRQFLGGRRRRRAAVHTVTSSDLLSNCGTDPSVTPSLHLVASDSDITMTVVTSQSPNGVTVSLPVHDAMNDVLFQYDGSHLSGIVNGYIRKLPLSGTVVKMPSPLTLGQCLFRDRNHFIGQIDLFELHACLP
ncbi:unnamed protein product [Lymnaea stagnalis]|uniref:Uncharacterized protein n=1 Tax=Lymnaea stagnalis TaxID=6523 RepID=A0AAV2H5V5_LYMST